MDQKRNDGEVHLHFQMIIGHIGAVDVEHDNADIDHITCMLPTSQRIRVIT